MQFDIEAFYPSISKALLSKALDFAKGYTIEIIMHSRRGVLWHKNEVWVKKQDPDFDISMGSYDGAECSEICGLYLQYSISEVHKVLPKTDFGLFRDDGVGMTRGGGPTADKKRKDIVKVMKSEGLNITGDCNLKSINFLDVNMSLNPNEHKPYVKPNSEIEYLDTRSNQPPVYAI